MRIALSRPRRTGVIGLVVLALLGVAVTVVSTVSFGTRHYTAVLAQTAGLREGEAVQVAGVEVGEVVSTELDGKHVRVRFTLDRDIELGSDTTAAVRVATLLGTHYLQVHPAGDGELDGDEIPLDRTTVPYNLQDVIDQGTDQLEQLDSAALAQALSAVTDTLRASGQDVGPALDGVTRLGRMVVRRGDEYAALFGAARDVSDQLSGSARDLVSLMQSSNLVLGELNKRRQVIHRLLVHVQSLATTVSGIVDDNDAEFGPLLEDLDTVLGVLRAKERQIASAVHRVAISSRYLANATGNGPWAELYVPDGTPDNVYCQTNRC